jgi:hypothetical protein
MSKALPESIDVITFCSSDSSSSLTSGVTPMSAVDGRLTENSSSGVIITVAEPLFGCFKCCSRLDDD